MEYISWDKKPTFWFDIWFYNIYFMMKYFYTDSRIQKVKYFTNKTVLPCVSSRIWSSWFVDDTVA